jgi:hypothetical protein
VKIAVFKIIILPVILCGCKTCSLILTEEHRLNVAESRVLSGIHRPARDEVSGDWKKVHNNDFITYTLPQL